MLKDKVERIAMLFEIEKLAKTEIEAFKEECRLATDEEIIEINKGKILEIIRDDKPITTRGEEYQRLEAELKEKYPTITTYEKNGKITLKPQNLTKSKTEIILQQIITQNKTTLKEMMKLAK